MSSVDYETVEPFSIDLELIDPFEAGELNGSDGAASPNEIHQLLLQTDEYASGVLYKTELQQLSYGTYNGRPAVFVAFQSQFHYSGRNRIRAANIKVSLSDAAQPTDPTVAPQVENIAPIWSKGKETAQKHSAATATGVSFGPPGAPRVMVGPQWTSSLVREQTRSTKVKGYIAPHHPRRHPNILNRVLWSVEENDADRDGIPPFFRAAMIVTTPHQVADTGSFLMTVEVEVTQQFYGTVISFFRKSRKDARSVKFTPSMSFRGNVDIAKEFELLNLDEWVISPRPGVVVE
ncbi:hypothetical protein FQN49_000919 [Arthroderma sp. PD_2]|nr:hypothetical protein FQN49_000919 [Arthroderma sp. PD_2]